MSRKIGILLTCVDDSDFAKAFPDDAEKFRRLLQPLRPDWSFITVPVKDNIFPENIADFDGYVITGSPKSVNGKEPWIKELLALIQKIEAQKIPMFGACFGHQAIAAALGGKVEKSKKGWGLGTAKTTFNDAAPWMQPMQKEMVLFAAHEDQVVAMPKGAVLLGGSEFCPIGAYRIGEHVFATEYHPEMTPDFVDGLLAFLDDELDSNTMKTARLTMKEKAEGPAFAHWIVNFLDQSKA